MHCRFIAGSLLLCSCAPIVLSDQINRQTLSERKERVVKPNSSGLIAEAVPSDDQKGLLVSVKQSERCDLTSILLVRSTRRVKREPDWSSALLWAGTGALSAGVGAWVLADASNVPQSGDPHTRNPVGRTGAYGIGSGLTIAGGAAIIAGVATFIRGIDSRENLGKKQVRGEPVEVACNATAAANIQIEMAPLVGGILTPPVSLGETSPDGKLRISKKQLRSLFESAPSAEKAQLRFGRSKRDIDLSATRIAMANSALETALSLAKADQVDEAKVELNFAAKLGAQTVSAHTAIADAPTTKRRLAEADAHRVAEAQRSAAETEAAMQASMQRYRAEPAVQAALKLARAGRIDEARFHAAAYEPSDSADSLVEQAIKDLPTPRLPPGALGGDVGAILKGERELTVKDSEGILASLEPARCADLADPFAERDCKKEIELLTRPVAELFRRRLIVESRPTKIDYDLQRERWRVAVTNVSGTSRGYLDPEESKMDWRLRPPGTCIQEGLATLPAVCDEPYQPYVVYLPMPAANAKEVITTYPSTIVAEVAIQVLRRTQVRIKSCEEIGLGHAYCAGGRRELGGYASSLLDARMAAFVIYKVRGLRLSDDSGRQLYADGVFGGTRGRITNGTKTNLRR